MNDTKNSKSSAVYRAIVAVARHAEMSEKAIKRYLVLGPDKIPLSDLKNAPIYKIDKVRVENTAEGPRVIIGPYDTQAGVMEITMKKEASALLLQMQDADLCEKTITEVVKHITEKVLEKYKQGKIKTVAPDLFSAAEK